MSEDDLLAMAPRVKAITAEHAVHFLWVPPHMILTGGRILEAWGFTFRRGSAACGFLSVRAVSGEAGRAARCCDQRQQVRRG